MGPFQPLGCKKRRRKKQYQDLQINLTKFSIAVVFSKHTEHVPHEAYKYVSKADQEGDKEIKRSNFVIQSMSQSKNMDSYQRCPSCLFAFGSTKLNFLNGKVKVFFLFLNKRWIICLSAQCECVRKWCDTNLLHGCGSHFFYLQ